MLLFVIRHGQTDYNRDGRLQGSMDIPLNETGREQARGNGKALAELFNANLPGANLPGIELELEDFDFVASPLGRTRETMELVREAAGLYPHDYRTDALLVELSFGDWEGQTLSELAEHSDSAQLLEQREQQKWIFRPPGERAESYADLAARIDRFLQTVHRPTICVAHGGVIRTLFERIGKISGDAAAVADIPQDRILKIENGTIGWL